MVSLRNKTQQKTANRHQTLFIMSTIITEQNFDELLNSGKPFMMDCGATWCGPCKSLMPIVDEIATEFEGRAIVATMDVEECSDIAARYRIRNVPTILFFKNGELKDKSVGSVQKSTLVEKLNALM